MSPDGECRPVASGTQNLSPKFLQPLPEENMSGGIIVFHTFSSTTARKYKGENENGQKSSKY